MKKLLCLSILINIVLLSSVVIIVALSSKEVVVVVTDESTQSMDSITRAYPTESEFELGKFRYVKLTECKRYYSNGNLRYKAFLIDGDYVDCFSYSPDGKEVCRFIGGSGELIIPDIKGKIPATGIYKSYESMNCYFRYGEPMSKAEYERREKLQDKRIDAKLEGAIDLDKL